MTYDLDLVLSFHGKHIWQQSWIVKVIIIIQPGGNLQYTAIRKPSLETLHEKKEDRGFRGLESIIYPECGWEWKCSVPGPSLHSTMQTPAPFPGGTRATISSCVYLLREDTPMDTDRYQKNVCQPQVLKGYQGIFLPSLVSSRFLPDYWPINFSQLLPVPKLSIWSVVGLNLVCG